MPSWNTVYSIYLCFTNEGRGPHRPMRLSRLPPLALQDVDVVVGAQVVAVPVDRAPEVRPPVVLSLAHEHRRDHRPATWSTADHNRNRNRLRSERNRILKRSSCECNRARVLDPNLCISNGK